MLVICSLISLGLGYAAVYDVFSMPNIPYDNTVQFYYLEASFPSNAPNSIMNDAGSQYLDFSTTHAGLGIWDVTGGNKFSVDLVSLNYTGALFPYTSGGIEKFKWDNGATIQVTNPLIDSNWVNSRLIVSTGGGSYQQFVQYLQNNVNQFKIYQPVSLTYATQDEIANYTGDSQLGTVSLMPFNSYTAVDIWVNQLVSFGCTVQAFLQVYSTGFYYLTGPNYVSESKRKLTDISSNNNNRISNKYLVSNEQDWMLQSDDLINIPNNVVRNIPVVSWTVESGVNVDVFNWYKRLEECYIDALDASIVAGSGASLFLQLIKHCYTNQAYVYLSPTSVYNVTLADYNSSSKTPTLQRYVYPLPSADFNTGQSLTMVDYAVSALIILAILSGGLYCGRKLFTKKQRRRVSFMGEQVAAKAVKSMAEEEQYHPSRIGYDNYYSSRHGSFSSTDLQSRAQSTTSPISKSKGYFGWLFPTSPSNFESVNAESPTLRYPPLNFSINVDSNDTLVSPLKEASPHRSITPPEVHSSNTTPTRSNPNNHASINISGGNNSELGGSEHSDNPLLNGGVGQSSSFASV